MFLINFYFTGAKVEVFAKGGNPELSVFYANFSPIIGIRRKVVDRGRLFFLGLSGRKIDVLLLFIYC